MFAIVILYTELNFNIKYSNKHVVEAQYIFFSAYVLNCGASEALNLCSVRGENPPVVQTQNAPILSESKITRVLHVDFVV